MPAPFGKNLAQNSPRTARSGQLAAASNLTERRPAIGIDA
jgi:hypothetical protein